MKFKIVLKNVGRGEYNGTKVVNVEDIYDAEQIALKEVGMHLISMSYELVPQKNSYGYNVYAGFHKVGEVFIKKLK